MVATAELVRSLYAAQEAWRPMKRVSKKKDKSTRAAVMFGTKIAKAKPSVPAATAQAARLARKAPQTMVKVSKATYGAAHTFSNLTYIARNGKVPMYDQDGVEISDVDVMRALAEEWHDLNYDPAEIDSRFASPDARRLILSMPRGTDAEIVLQSARSTARHLFEDKFDYVFALHTDEGKGKSPNPHVHLTVRAHGHDGTRLEFGPQDLLYMRRVFAAELRQRGVDADATPQIARGPRLNNEHSKTYQARLNVEKNNNSTEKPRRAFARDSRRAESGEDREFMSGAIVKTYSELMEQLAKSRDAEFQQLDRDFGAFVRHNFGNAINAERPPVVPDRSLKPGVAQSPPKSPKL